MNEEKNHTADSNNEITVTAETSPDDVDLDVGAMYWTNTPHDSDAPGPYQFVIVADHDPDDDQFTLVADLPQESPFSVFEIPGNELRNNISRGWYRRVARPLWVARIVTIGMQEGAIQDGEEQ